MIKIILSIFTVLFISGLATAQINEKQANINSIFDKMELQGIDTQQPMLYGFFFYDKDKSKLEKLKNELVKDNYKLVRLEKTDKKDFILHVEKVEIHSRASLLERENKLGMLSTTFQVASYDGWDVGNADPTKPLVTNESFYQSLATKSKTEVYSIANKLYDSEINDKAIVAFDKCIELNYRVDTCLYKQGVCFISLGQTKIGVEQLEEAVKINPTYFKAYFNLGANYYNTQQYQKSIDNYTKASKLAPNDDSVYYGIAASQFMLGQLEEAKNNCQQALKLNPNNDNAKALWDHIKKK